jgi:SanA protein
MYRAMRYYGVTDAIVCTEAFAMPRTLYLARQNGIDAVGYELPSALGRASRRLGAEALKATLAVIEETFAPRDRAPVAVAHR